MRAILINPEVRTITEVEHNGDYKQIYEYLQCGTFTAVGIEHKDGASNAIFVDDEGLLNDPRFFFLYKGYNQPLANNGLILGSDEEGETVGTTLSLEHVKSRVRFVELSVEGWEEIDGVTGPDHPMGEGFQIIGHQPIFGPPKMTVGAVLNHKEKP